MSPSIVGATTRVRRLLERLESPSVVNRVRERKLTYLDRNALRWLAEQVTAIERARVPGIMIEAGCALGGSSIVMAATKTRARQLVVYDVFGQIPPPSDKDGADVHARYETIASGKSSGIGGDQYYGYETDLLARVRSNFDAFGFPPEQHNVHLVKGLYQDTLHPQDQVALAHIDCDWYESVMTCLQRIVPCLAPSGRLVIDDYFVYSGCRAAVWDYFRPRMEVYRFTYGPRLLVTSV